MDRVSKKLCTQRLAKPALDSRMRAQLNRVCAMRLETDGRPSYHRDTVASQSVYETFPES